MQWLSRTGTVWVAVILGLAAGLHPGPAVADLISYRAVYLLSLDKNRTLKHITGQESDIADAQGFMTMESRRACKGITSYQHFVLNISDRSGYQTLIESRFSSWEKHDAYEFESTQWHNKSRVFHQKGRVDAAKNVIYEHRQSKGEKERSRPLPPQAIFPAAHLQTIINAASDGKKVINNLVFDGANDDGPYYISTFISPRRPLEKPKHTDEWSLTTYWPVLLSYYKYDAEEQVPFFQLSVEMTPQGIANALTMDYENFSVRGIPESITVLPDSQCKGE